MPANFDLRAAALSIAADTTCTGTHHCFSGGPIYDALHVKHNGASSALSDETESDFTTISAAGSHN